LPLAFYSCEPEFDDVEFNSGGADFSRMVAVGNSLTAGIQSAALRRDKQENSFPAILARQMELAGGGSFTQPLLSDGVGIGSSGDAELGLSLKPDCLGEIGPSPEPIAAVGQIDALLPSSWIGGQGPFNNVGVPGAKSFHLLSNGYGDPSGINQTNPSASTSNAFYVRFANPLNFQENVLEAAMRVNPTFFTLWIGNNDILSYATSGGSGQDQTGNLNPATYGQFDLTDPNVFANTYSILVNTLTSTGAKGVVANIPDVTSIPFFTTVPWNALVLTEAQANLLNAGFKQYNDGMDAVVTLNPLFKPEAERRKMNFKAGPNGFVIMDNDLTGLSDPMGNPVPKMRQIRAGELVLLTVSQDDIKCGGLGSANVSTGMPNPIGDDKVLDSLEIDLINKMTTAYNNSIKSIADANGLAFVDAKTALAQVANGGYNTNGTILTDEFATGGAFSLDGIHPSSKGYALTANFFIEAINQKYGSTLSKVDVNLFPGLD